MASNPASAFGSRRSHVEMHRGPKLDIVNLGESLKPRPRGGNQPRDMKRVGIVPLAEPQPHREALRAHRADGFQFPPNGGVTDTNVTFHGGTTAGGVTVQLIFWGPSWNGSDAGLCNQIINAAMNLIDGPYTSAVDQYGLAWPTMGGSIVVLSPSPPSTFDDGNVGDIVWNLIDDNHYPEPDDGGGRNFYAVFMPRGPTTARVARLARIAGRGITISPLTGIRPGSLGSATPTSTP